MTSLEDVLLAEAHRQLDQQLSDLDSVRSRAVGLLGAAGVVAGLFVGRFNVSFNGFGWAALAFLVLGALAALDVILPRDLAVGLNLRSSLDWYHDHGSAPHSAAIFEISEAENLHRVRAANTPVIRRLTYVFSIECGLLGLQLLMWVLSVAVA